MAIPIIPKSEARINNNISVGFGEVPATFAPCGRIAWGLPNGELVYTKEEAEDYAKELDRVIRANMRSPKQLLH